MNWTEVESLLAMVEWAVPLSPFWLELHLRVNSWLSPIQKFSWGSSRAFIENHKKRSFKEPVIQKLDFSLFVTDAEQTVFTHRNLSRGNLYCHIRGTGQNCMKLHLQANWLHEHTSFPDKRFVFPLPHTVFFSGSLILFSFYYLNHVVLLK